MSVWIQEQDNDSRNRATAIDCDFKNGVASPHVHGMVILRRSVRLHGTELYSIEVNLAK
jgi:hypothetical protein